MAMTVNGVSTTQSLGEEQYEFYRSGKRKLCQYDYRHTDGELFSIVRPTLEACRSARDQWIKNRG